MQILPLPAGGHQQIASLIHRALVAWYETRLRQGARFGSTAEPFLLFPAVYEALDPGQAVGAFGEDGALWGVCFIHERETHFALGILATDPGCAGRGVARELVQVALGRARLAAKPVRLVSSLLNLDSFSLYTRLGFHPHTIYQDLAFDIPACGMVPPAPESVCRVRPAREADVARIADLEMELQGVRREKDYRFFWENRVGQWRVWVCEDASGGLCGALVSSDHPHWGMLGPGVARDTPTALGLLWTALDAQRGRNTVVLAPSSEVALVSALYAWGGRNIELHAAQILGSLPLVSGIAFPTFLPESA
jgi:ribosomal protein S18 acetylase RimI-like enzyme